MKLDFWFEFGSTYSYPTAMRIEDLAKNRTGRAFICPSLGHQIWGKWAKTTDLALV